MQKLLPYFIASQIHAPLITLYKMFRSVYTYCESADVRPDGSLAFEHKDYCPVNLDLQHIASQLKAQVI